MTTTKKIMLFASSPKPRRPPALPLARVNQKDSYANLCLHKNSQKTIFSSFSLYPFAQCGAGNTFAAADVSTD